MSVSAPAAGKRRPSPEKLQRKETVRMRLFEAAGRIVGRYGYAGCSVARVTARARVAHGTFYLHFKSQQDLFDQLVPTLGSGMLDAIGQSVHHSKDIIELERRGLTANFDYLVKHPYMARVVSEAELYAPKAHREYLDEVTRRYQRALHHGLIDRQFSNFSEDELGYVAVMLIGARTLLLKRFCTDGGTIKPPPPELVEAYLRFAAQGLGIVGAPPGPGRS